MLAWHSQNSLASPLFLVHVFPIHRVFYYLQLPTSKLQELAVDLSAGHAGKQTDDTTLLLSSSNPPYSILLTCLVCAGMDEL